MNFPKLLSSHAPTNGASHSVGADAAAKPRNPLRTQLPAFVHDSLLTMAENLFRSATREQLQKLAQRAVEVDRDRALAMSFLLAWAAAGKEPAVPTLKNDVLSWIFTATPDELRQLGGRLVALSTPGASMLAAGIRDACEQRTRTLLR